MTLRELQSEICTLGFENCVEPDINLFRTMRRALSTMARDIPRKKRVTIFANFPKPAVCIDVQHHMGGRTEILPLTGSAFSLRTAGKGEITVYDGRVNLRIPFDSSDKIIKACLYGEGSLTLSGDTSYDIFDLTVYGEPYFSDAEDIPSGSRGQCIDLSERLSDFLALAEFPTDKNGNPIAEVKADGGTLLFPQGFEGEICVSYYSAVPVPEFSDPDSPIDIPGEYRPLLPLLCSSYVLLDEDPDKSKQLYSFYLDGVAASKKLSLLTQTANYIDVNGWAKWR